MKDVQIVQKPNPNLARNNVWIYLLSWAGDPEIRQGFHQRKQIANYHQRGKGVPLPPRHSPPVIFHPVIIPFFPNVKGV